MTKQPDPDRDRLVAAAVQARGWLRGILPELDRAIAAGGDVELLKRLRALAGFHATKLGHVLKRPDPPRPRNADSRALEPLWRVAEGNRGQRYQRPARAAHSKGV